MSEKRCAEIKDYICKTFVKEDDTFSCSRKLAQENGLRNITIPEQVGKFIYLLAKIQKPKRILEIGTLWGYSTLWLAKGAPNAEIITIENNPKHAAIARENFKKAGQNIKLIEDDALKVLKTLEGKFDLIFLDAEKRDYPLYLPLLIALGHSGTLLLTDNLIPREEPINNPLPKHTEAINTYHYNDMLASNEAMETVLVTTITDKGRIDALGISLLEFVSDIKN